MPSNLKLVPHDSWLGTRRIWTPCQLDGTEAKCLLFPFRLSRAPWLKQDRLLAVVCGHQIMLFRNDKLPQQPLKFADAILAVKPAEYALSTLDEWSVWPASAALLEGLIGADPAEFEPKGPMADFVLKCWNAAPLPGWQPVHRGSLGLSFVRNVTNNQADKLIAAEVTSNALLLYKKAMPECEALKDHDVIKRWSLHDMEPTRLCVYLDAEDIIQVRLIMRYRKMWEYQYFLSQEALPF